MDDEILQDFLLEAGEILEQLDSQLVDLESDPQSAELLNAVFRGFHTIKGGAGFLGLDNLVAVSHKSEDIFGLLREDKLRIDPAMMDAFLQVLDVLRQMFDELNDGSPPEPAPGDLLARLAAYASGSAPPESEMPAMADGSAVDTSTPQAPAADAVAESGTDEALMSRIIDEVNGGGDETDAAAPAGDPDLISEDEFDELLDKLDTQRAVGGNAQDEPAHSAAGSPDLITEDEFEALLDKRDAANSAPAEPRAGDTGAAELITDEEFEAVLDDLHGKGRFKAEAAPGPEAESHEEAAPEPHVAPDPQAEATPEPSAPTPVAEPAPAAPAAHKKSAPQKEGNARAGAAKDTTVRVETRTLDRIMNMVGELVLIRNRLSNLQSSVDDENVSQAVANLDVVTSDLQTAAMKTRMQPIKKVFGRFPRVVRDLARSLGKTIDLQMSGEDTDLDKNLVEALSDPLVHLVRNSVDHGIEMPEDRVAAGKSATGSLRLSAAQAGDQIQLIIADDGKGIDAEALRAKAVASGLLEEDAAARLNTRECFELIFLPGFSTKKEVSDISGRGVGMDVVKTRITQLNGSITIDSELGAGTTIAINVPLTLAIMPTLMVVLGSQVFALPLVNVQEIINFESQHSRIVDGRQTMNVRGRAIPLFYLSRWLVQGAHEFDASTGHVVVTRIGNQSVGLLVDDLIGQEEVVIKPLGALLHGIKGLAGATITGNGRIALIIDLPGLLEAYARR